MGSWMSMLTAKHSDEEKGVDMEMIELNAADEG
jgi:hypothetical protein